MRLGQILQKWRLMSDLTLREVAKLMKVSLPTVQRIEQGRQMDGETLAKVLMFLMSEAK